MAAKYKLLGRPDVRQFWQASVVTQPVLFSCLCILNILIGYGLRSYLVPVTSAPVTSSSELLKFSQVEKTFTYRQDLADHPTKESNHAWHELFPEQGGYFQHPTISPERATFSGFHQLHCLNNIRMGYWRIWDIAKSGKPSDLDELSMMEGPPHVRHCIDLIRQSLMCTPDLTVEVKDEEIGGVHGFGTTHTCTDWDELVAWLTEWEVYGSPEKGAPGTGGHGH